MMAGTAMISHPRFDCGERLLVVGAYGMGNLGDEAILSGLLTEYGDHRQVTVVSGAPAQTSAMHRVRAIGPMAAPKALFECDTVIVGGGGLFSSDVGALARAIPPFALLARGLRKRLIIRGVSIDRSTPVLARGPVRLLAMAAEFVGVRDAHSAQFLRLRGIDCAVEDDLSARMAPAPRRRAEHLLAAAGVDSTRPVIGLCLTSVNGDLAEKTLHCIPELVAAFPEAQFCLVPMSRHRRVSSHNDLLFARLLRSRCDSLAIVDNISHPSDALALFDHFDVAVCARYHALLFAERMGTPIVALPYAAKCEDWLASRRMAPTRAESAALIPAVAQALLVPSESRNGVARC